MTRWQLLHSMPASELVYWRARCRIEPIGHLRQDLRVGKAVSEIVNLLRMQRNKNATLTKPSDWVMEFPEQADAEPQAEQQTPEQMKFLLQALASSYEKKERRKGK